MAQRIQSPSSINTYKQCPRKYYYQYIKRLKTSPSIHTIRGNIVHTVLEEFYEIDPATLTQENYENFMRQRMEEILVKTWREKHSELQTLGLPTTVLQQYFDETVLMLINWFCAFVQKIKKHKGQDLSSVFRKLTPIREEHIVSERHQLQGHIDAIEVNEGLVRIMDYKTSKRAKITPEYKLQLAIYVLLYHAKYAKMPEKVGMYFLNDVENFEQEFPVDQSLLDYAKFEVQFIHTVTQSDNLQDYPLKPGPLCKWSTGECDFYKICFGQKKIDEF